MLARFECNSCEGFDEKAKRVDDYGGIAKTKTDSSNYDNPPAMEKLRVLVRSRLLHAGWLIECADQTRALRLGALVSVGFLPQT